MTQSDDARNPARVAPRVVFCGMTGEFSLLALEALLDRGIPVVAIVLPALRGRAGQPSLLPQLAPLPQRPVAPQRAALPMLGVAAPRTILNVAAERNIPTLELGAGPLPDALTTLNYDAIAVACFSRKLPASLLRLPRLGCLNVHPSLLPAHRGPDPLFWVFHDGDEVGGVTIHMMDEGFDSGPILIQEKIPLLDGLTEAALERFCASRGGALLVEALIGLAAGALQPQPQDKSLASYQSWPQEEDYTITPTWSARRAHRFVAGVASRPEPIRFAADDGATFTLAAALDYDSDATLDTPWRLDDDVLAAQCSPGILRCRIVR
jgi:methionyl-tRNA formyltransferase